MEFVDGVPLDEYLIEKAPSIRARVELCWKMCSAVAAAHERGIVHRDLKPGNILVEDSGEPRVVDFGLASLTEDFASLGVGGRSFARTMTGTGQFVGTLAWASPEQARGDSSLADVRTDVHALGLIMFAAVTGEQPYQTDAPLQTALRNIAQAPPPRPSAIRAGLDADLDTIILKCLAKEPSARYASAGAVADELRRYLDHKTILARPMSISYRVRRFSRRNRALVIGASGVVAALTAGLVVSLWFLVQSQQQRRVATDRAYVAAVKGADMALQNLDGGAARRALQSVEAPERRWEWRYLNEKVSGGSRVIFSGPAVHDVVLPQNGKVIVLMDEQGTRAMDTRTLTTLWQFAGSSWYGRTSVGDRVCALKTAERVDVIEIASGRQLGGWNSIPGETDVSWAALNETGTRVAQVVRMKHSFISVVDTQSGKELWRVAPVGGIDYGSPIVFLPSDRGVLLLANNHTLLTFNVETGIETDRFTDKNTLWISVSTPALSPDGSMLALHSDQGIIIYSLRSSYRERLRQLSLPAERITTMHFDAESRHLIANSSDAAVRVWDLSLNEPPQFLLSDGVQDAVLVDTADDALTASTLGIVRRWKLGEIGRARRSWEWHEAGGVRCVAFTPDSRTCIAATGHLIQHIDIASGSVRTITGDWCDVNSQRPSINARREVMIAPIVTDTVPPLWQLAAWHLGDRKPLWADPPASGWIWLSAISPDGKTGALPTPEGADILLREIDTGKIIQRLRGPASLVNGYNYFAFSPDGRVLYAACNAPVINAWSTTSGAMVGEWRLPGAEHSRHLAISADGRLLATGCSDTTIALLETSGGRVVRALGPTGSSVWALAFSPDGSRMASGGFDRCIHIWDTATGAELLTDRDYRGEIRTLAWSPDGCWLAVGDRQGKLVLMFAPSTEPER